jgi:GTP pyrophosphokinase
MFLAMAKDIRVILIKLADRLHNMRTLQHLKKPEKRKRIAEETLTIYSPIASRLGIYKIKNELDSLCFQHLYPKDHKRIQKELDEISDVKTGVINISKDALADVFNESDFKNISIEGRVKNLYSIFKKLKKKGKNYVSELYDIFALRIVVESEAQCYQVLGLIHKHWTPLQRRFKDYIAVPKSNGYQSLHTTIIGLCPKLHNQPLEVQIRTEEMNDVAEFGIAAHWSYKEKGAEVIGQQKLNWVQSLVDLHENLQSNAEFIESLSVDIFHDRIFILTPKGDVLDLPYGATPVDFAYAIHSSVGHKCKQAKANGRIVPLDYKLKNGQVLEILTGNTEQPNRYWLSFVKTAQAKTRIKQWFNMQDRDKIIKMGKDYINKKLKQFNQPPLDPNLTLFKIYGADRLSIRDRESLVEKIGNGSLGVMDVLKKVLPVEKVMKPATKKEMAKQVLAESVSFQERPEILITGEKGYQTQMASCCKPTPDDEIIGYITRGKGVTIHKKNCKMLKGLNDARFIKTNWSSTKIAQYTVKLRIDRRSRIGLLRDVADVYANNQLPISDIENVREKDTDMGYMLITANLDSLDTLNKLIHELEQVDGVFGVKEID